MAASTTDSREGEKERSRGGWTLTVDERRVKLETSSTSESGSGSPRTGGEEEDR